MNHPFFEDINWEMLLKKKIKPEYIPEISNKINCDNFEL